MISDHNQKWTFFEKVSKIISLNGCASVGKSTLTKEIQNLSKEKYLYFGIDALFGAMSEKLTDFDQKSKEGLWCVIDPETNRFVEMKISSYAGQVFSSLPKMTKLLDDSGLNVIFDECNFVKKTMMNFNWWLQKTFLRAQFLYD